MRILLIDDRALAPFVTEALKHERFDVYAVNNGEDGLTLGLMSRFDIVLIGHVLPDMVGLDVVRGLRAAMVMTPALVLVGQMDKWFRRRELVARIHGLVGRPGEVYCEPAERELKLAS